MADIVHRFGNVRRLSTHEEAKLRFKPSPVLEKALRSMIRPEEGLRGESAREFGHTALFLYSHPQNIIRKLNGERGEPSPELHSQVEAHIKSLHERFYPLARSVVPRVEATRTGFQFSVLPDVTLQRQIHACYPYGLNESLFGRKAIEAIFWLPNTDIVRSREERRAASREIKAAVWGHDDINTPSDSFHPPEKGGTQVHGIEWVVKRR